MGLLGSLLTVLVATGVIDHASGQNLPVRFISTCPPLIFFSRCGVFRLHPVLRQAGALLAPVLQPKRGGPRHGRGTRRPLQHGLATEIGGGCYRKRGTCCI